MIYTLTLNPALDLELQIEQFAFNSVARASHSQRDCGGKGLNVSRMLRHLNVDSIAMGFVGGYNGQRLQSDLTALGVQTLFTPIAAETRTNVSIVATGSSQHIKVNEAGPAVSVTEWDQLISTIKQYLTPGDWWVLAGSLPQGVPDMAYADLITLIEGAGAYVILDASGAAFGKQFKRADRSGARWAAVIGEEEALEGLVGLKDLRAGTGQADQRLTPEALLEAMTPQDLSTDGCQARV